MADPEALATYLAGEGPAVMFFGIAQDPEATLAAVRKCAEHCRRPGGRPGSPAAIIGITTRASSDLLLEAVRAGIDEFLTPPLDDKTVRDCIRNVCEKKGILQTAPNSRGGRIFTVFSGKGGCGKTTLATNLAYQLAQLPERSVLVLDLNLQFGNAATFLDLQPRHTIIDCLTKEGGVVEDEMLVKLPCRHASGVAVLSGPDDPADSDQLKPDQTLALLESLKGRYDFVVVDTISNFDENNLTALDVADRIILLTDTLVPSVRNTQRCLKVFSKLDYDLDKVVLVVNRFDKNVGAGAKELQQAFDIPISGFIPNEFAAVMSAVDAGLPIAEATQKSGVTAALKQLAHELVGAEPESEAPRPWFKKLLVRK